MPTHRAGALVLLLTLVVATGCAAPAATPSGLVNGRAAAGPVCPVVTDPPDPGCADRPVAGAAVVALDESGREVARTRTGADGRYTLTVPHGRLRIVALPVEGLFAVSDPVPVVVDGRDIAHVADFSYDTGIR